MTNIINPYRYGSSGISLLPDLISYWKLDESSGSAIDSHGSNDLSVAGTAASVTGIIGNGRNVSSAEFSRADNAALSMGDIGFTLQAWVNRASSALSVNRGILGKWNFTANQYEYLLYLNTSNELQFVVSPDGDVSTSVTASTFGTVPTSAWVHAVAYHDASADEIGIVVNGISDTLAYSSGVHDGTSVFYMGSLNSVTNTNFPGSVDECAVWKRVLSSAEISGLYNSGSGLSYDSF